MILKSLLFLSFINNIVISNILPKKHTITPGRVQTN